MNWFYTILGTLVIAALIGYLCLLSETVAKIVIVLLTFVVYLAGFVIAIAAGTWAVHTVWKWAGG